LSIISHFFATCKVDSDCYSGKSRGCEKEEQQWGAGHCPFEPQQLCFKKKKNNATAFFFLLNNDGDNQPPRRRPPRVSRCAALFFAKSTVIVITAARAAAYSLPLPTAKKSRGSFLWFLWVGRRTFWQEEGIVWSRMIID
jgi:hypothetical protein